MGRNLALTIIFSMCIMGPLLVFATATFASIQAMGRNPSAAPKILAAMTLSLIFAESVAIIAFLIIWQLYAPTG